MSEGEYLRHKGTLVPLYLPTSYHCFTFFAMIFITKFCRSTFSEKMLDRKSLTCYTKNTYAGSFFAPIFRVSEKLTSER